MKIPTSEIGSTKSLYQLLLEADANVQRNADLKSYVGLGVAASNEVCANWLRALSDARTDAKYWSDTAGIAGTLTAAVMGLAESAAVVGNALGRNSVWWLP